MPEWIVLLPPLLVLLCAMLTRKLQLSIFVGLVSSSLIATDASLIASGKLIAIRLYEQIIDPEMLYVYLFLFCIGILISLINHTGATKSFALYVKQRIRERKSAEIACFSFSALLGIDDYLSSLTVGYVMRPLIDSFGIARAKLAFLIHTFAAPLVILIPISTWATYVTSQLDSAGINTFATTGTKFVADPFFVYLQTIGYMYYPIFMLATALFIIYMNISYGPMKPAEYNAHETHIQLDDTDELDAHYTPSIIGLVTPGLILLTSLIVGMLWTGGFWLFGGTKGFIQAFSQNDHAFAVLGLSAATTASLSIICAWVRGTINACKVPSVIVNGIQLMFTGVALVITASTLGTILRIDVQTGHYLAGLLLAYLAPALLPLMFFGVSALCSTLIGTAWGTIALLLPIGIPMAHTLLGLPAQADITQLSLLIPAISALLAGATFGDHTSPISAAGILSATAAGCDPIIHVQTQLPYALGPLIGSAVAFFVVGYIPMPAPITYMIIPIASGLLVSFGLTWLMNKFKAFA